MIGQTIAFANDWNALNFSWFWSDSVAIRKRFYLISRYLIAHNVKPNLAHLIDVWHIECTWIEIVCYRVYTRMKSEEKKQQQQHKFNTISWAHTHTHIHTTLQHDVTIVLIFFVGLQLIDLFHWKLERYLVQTADLAKNAAASKQTQW